MIEWATRKQ